MFKMIPTENELTEALRGIQVLQKKSDDVAFKINEGITSGAVSPNVIDSLLRCDIIIGDVVDLSLHQPGTCKNG